MGESHSLFRIVLFLGFILLMGSALSQPWVYVGQPLPPNSAWGQFSNGIQNFPQFSNPFAAVQSTVSRLHPVESALPWNAPATGCNPDHYAVSCLQSIDNATYIRLQFVNAGNSCTANVSCGTAEAYLQGGAPTHFTLTDFTVTVYCRATTSVPAKWAMFFRTFSDVTVHTCPQSTIFQPVSFSFPLSGDKEPTAPTCFWSDIFTYRAFNSAGVCSVDTDLTHHPGIQADIEVCGITAVCPASDGTSGPFEITAIIVDATFTVPQASCSTFDVGCVVARFFDPVVKGLQWLANGIVFVFQVIGWFIGMVGLFFGALLSVLSIPGAPPLITGMVGIIVIGCLFFVSIVIMGKIRGTGNVG